MKIGLGLASVAIFAIGFLLGAKFMHDGDKQQRRSFYELIIMRDIDLMYRYENEASDSFHNNFQLEVSRMVNLFGQELIDEESDSLGVFEFTLQRAYKEVDVLNNPGELNKKLGRDIEGIKYISELIKNSKSADE